MTLCKRSRLNDATVRWFLWMGVVCEGSRWFLWIGVVCGGCRWLLWGGMDLGVGVGFWCGNRGLVFGSWEVFEGWILVVAGDFGHWRADRALTRVSDSLL